jgi:glucan 1,3-beta-glucosidase
MARSPVLPALLAPAVLAAAAVLVLLFIGLQARPVAVADGPPGKIACVSYAPFRDGQTPFDADLVIPPEQIEEDMTVLARITDCVRTYSVSQGLDRVPEIAARHGLSVHAGAWIGRDALANDEEISRLIALARRYPAVLRSVIVGNEVLLRGEQTAPALAALLRRVRAAVPATVPVSYADVWEFWLDHPDLTAAVDVVTVHILPYWEDDPTAVEAAVDHVMRVWGEVSAHYAPKPVLIGETGWPSAGRRREDATPGRVAQTRFIRGVLSAAEGAGAAYNVIESFDQPWKRDLEGTVGGAWGLLTADRQPKVTLHGPVAERPDALPWLAAAVVLGLLPLAAALARREAGGGRARAVLAAGGLMLAGTSVLQAWHMLEASRNALEWAVNGGWLAVSAGLGIALLRHLAGLPCRLPVDRAQLLATAAMTVASLGLLFEPRYRDMPVSMVLALAVFLALVPGTAPRRETRALAMLLAVSVCGIQILEGPLNTQAWLWTATGLLLALPALWPRRSGGPPAG